MANPSTVVALLIILSSQSGIVLASDIECQTILSADQAKAKAAAWHQRMKSEKSGLSLEMIKVDGQLYKKEDDTWQRLPPAMIKAMEQTGLSSFPITDCAQIGTERVGNQIATQYSYSMTLGGHSATDNRVWIGQDGLPYRLDSDTVHIDISYQDVRAPVIAR